MTLKTCYPKLLWNTLIKRCWYGATTFLVLFIAMPLAAMLSFTSAEELSDAYRLHRAQIEFVEFVSGGTVVVMLLVVGLALLGAWSGLAWLHSRKQMDLYGSLPVKREVLYGMECASAVIWFMFSYVCQLVLTILVGAQKGILTTDAIKFAVVSIGIYLLGYLAFYFLAAVAMMLTGKILTGILGTFVFLGIAPVTILLLITLPDIFFISYVMTVSWLQELAVYLSPVIVWFGILEEYAVYTDTVVKMCIPVVLTITLVLWIVVGGIVSVVLLKIRPAEGAEQSMVFPKTEGIIKACILYPAAIGGGLFFMELGYRDDGLGWLWFGMFFVILVIGILIEIIYHRDRKRIFDHKICTGIVAVAAVFTILFFRYDPFGVDCWIPNENEVEHMVLVSGGHYNHFQYPDGSKNSEVYLRNNIEKIDSDALYKYLPEGLELIKKYKDMRNGDLEAEKYLQKIGYGVDFTVVFQMKNGTMRERHYILTSESMEALEKELFTEETYKEAWYPLILAEDDAYQISYLYHDGQKIDLSNWTLKENREFVNIYKGELKQMSYEQILDELGNVYAFEFEKADGEWASGSYPLNAHFEKSLAYLASLEEKNN